MSCSGCKVLRKGCGEDCSIRPCLQWIKTPEAQGHATAFLVKFYGRAGLLNLIYSAPKHLAPAVFRSMLYEACGRILNPIYGSVGLLWSGSWSTVVAAVDAVLRGEQIVPIPSQTAAATAVPVPHLIYDIRHVSKPGPDSELHKASKTMRTQFKRTAEPSKVGPPPQTENEPELSHDSSCPDPIDEPCPCCGGECEVSVGSVETSLDVSQGEPGPVVECEGLNLDLTLGFGLGPARRDADQIQSEPNKRCESGSGGSTGACSLGTELRLSAWK